MSANEYYNQGPQYPQHPQQSYAPPQMGYNNNSPYPPQGYPQGGYPQQGGYAPQQGMQYQQAPQQVVVKEKKSRGCLGTCLFFLCCCFICEEGCECCFEACECCADCC